MHQVGGLVTSQEEEEEEGAGASGCWGIWVMQQLSAADLSLTLPWTLSSLFTFFGLIWSLQYIINISSEIYDYDHILQYYITPHYIDDFYQIIYLLFTTTIGPGPFNSAEIEKF